MTETTLDNQNSEMLNSVKETIKASTIWTKLVKTIQNSNIDIDKLIRDSVHYGLEIGMFQQNKDGNIIYLDQMKKSKVEKNNKKRISDESSNKNSSFESHTIHTRSISRSESDAAVSVSSSVRSSRNCFKKASPDLTSPVEAKRFRLDSPSKQLEVMRNGNDQKLTPKFTQKSKPIVKKMKCPVPVCAYCLGDEALNKRTYVQEDMISCWDCGTCAHPICLQWPKKLFEKVRNIRWQCLKCKCCSYCGTTSKNDDNMLLCDACDLGFHTYCCDPPIKAPPKGEWICRICRPLSGHHKVQSTAFSNSDFDFKPDCQVVTPESVKLWYSSSIKQQDEVKPVSNTKSLPPILSTTKYKSKQSAIKKSLKKVNLLHLKRRKLVGKAVQRKRGALTDGLSKYFTPSNKRQSRVSKQTLSEKSTYEFGKNIAASDASSNEKTFKRSPDFSTSLAVDTSNIEKHLSDPKEQVRVHPNNQMLADVLIYNSPKAEKKEASFKKSCKKCSKMKYGNNSNIKTTDIVKVKVGRGRPKKIVIDTNSSYETTTNATESSSVNTSKMDKSTSLIAIEDNDPETSITELDRKWFSEIQQKVADQLPPPVDLVPHLQENCGNFNKNNNSKYLSDNSGPPSLIKESSSTTDECNFIGDHLNNQRNPPRIQIGKYIIDTWYSAPYPSEYARLSLLYICEYCLKHIKSYEVYIMHMSKCKSYFPPGNEVYRKGDLSVFEVDGYVSKLYCQQLCLLAKLFLDHKTLYYDVEPFLFYVAVLAKNNSTHIIGYFSKEKRSTHKYNLSCIMVLPPYQKFNYGRFLIDFSYLLSLKEGECGSPEKPLSTLGRFSYESYWKSKIIPYLFTKDDATIHFYRNLKQFRPLKSLSITIDKISTETGINPHDVTYTIQQLSKRVDLDDSDRITIQFDLDKLKTEAEKFANRYDKWILLDADCLRWAPLVNSNDKQANQLHTIIDKDIMKDSNDSSKSVIDKKKHKKTLVKHSAERSVKREKRSIPKQSTSPMVLSSSSDKRSVGSDIKHDLLESEKDEKLFHSEDSNKATIDAQENYVSSKRKTKRIISNSAIETPIRCTRSRSSKMDSLMEVVPLRVDLTKELSDNSDTIDNEDCFEVTAVIPTKPKRCRGSKPVLEIMEESFDIGKGDVKLVPEKESPPINRNETSPISTFNNNTICSALISPEIDEDNDEDTEIDPVIGFKRKPYLILEKCDSKFEMLEYGEKQPDISETIDISDDSSVTVDGKDKRNDYEADKETVLAQTENVIDFPDIIPDQISTAKLLEQCSTPLDIVFALPVKTRDRESSVDKEQPPVLSRIPSQEELSTSLHHDDSSNSLQLPSEFSQNEEFKNFYNNGNVFNSITTSQTDSTDKDANESILSTFSDLEFNGVCSCDSSNGCHNNNNKQSSSSSCNNKGSSDDASEDPFRCSPGQSSDNQQNQVSSTTSFIVCNSNGSHSHESVSCKLSSQNNNDSSVSKTTTCIDRLSIEEATSVESSRCKSDEDDMGKPTTDKVRNNTTATSLTATTIAITTNIPKLSTSTCKMEKSDVSSSLDEIDLLSTDTLQHAIVNSSIESTSLEANTAFVE